LYRPCLDDEEARGIEAESDEAWPVRASPFARGVFSETPQQELPGPGSCRALSDHGKSKTERGGGIAVRSRFDLVQPCLGEPMQG
jgi:hypothetical protein